MAVRRFAGYLSRTKTVTQESLSTSELSRCLGLIDLTAIGVGSTLGVGVYVLTGEIARTTAGPSVVLSFALAAFVSLLSGLCYAEFGARFPITGSAYSYAYVSVGEFIAFVIGWSMLAENIVAGASVGKAWSGYFDSFLNRSISTYIEHNLGTFDSTWLGDYPDILAMIVLMIMTLVITSGAKFSSWGMIGCTAVNLLVILVIVCVGIFYVDIHNWVDYGGFTPYGLDGVMTGAAVCFFAFVGFDVIATSSEEAKNPGRDIPGSIGLTLLICFLAYSSISIIITLIVPYTDISPTAPLAEAFAAKGLIGVQFIISIGSVMALTCAMLGAMFALPRITYAMARDGLLFPFLARVHPKTQVPITATIIGGIFTGVLATIFSLNQLVEMMSIGTLLSYLLVAVSVLLLRYKPGCIGIVKESARIFETKEDKFELLKEEEDIPETLSKPELQTESENSNLISNGPTSVSYMRVSKCSALFVIICFPLCTILIYGSELNILTQWYSLILLCFFGISILACGYMIQQQPQNLTELSYKAPFLPTMPLLSVFCDIYLIMQLSFATWIRFTVWLILGLVIYFGYGLWHAKVIFEPPPQPSKTAQKEPAPDGE